MGTCNLGTIRWEPVTLKISSNLFLLVSVEDPHVFESPRSGSVSEWYGSRSGSFTFLIKVTEIVLVKKIFNTKFIFKAVD
jgi:hypothetical protein